MKLYFDSHIENAYKADKTAIHTGRYQGNCVASGTNPENWGGLNEQGTHHLVVGWWKNLNKLIQLLLIIHIIFKQQIKLKMIIVFIIQSILIPLVKKTPVALVEAI